MMNDSLQNSSYLEYLQELSELLTREREAREETASLPVRECVPPVPSPLGKRGEPNILSESEDGIRAVLTPFAGENLKSSHSPELDQPYPTMKKLDETTNPFLRWQEDLSEMFEPEKVAHNFEELIVPARTESVESPDPSGEAME